MGLLIVILILAAAIWFLANTCKKIRELEIKRKGWIAFFIFSILGVAMGCYCAFFVEYQVSPKVKLMSFPLPLAVFKLEDGRWIDYVPSPLVIYAGVLANITAVTAISNLPLFFVLRRSAQLQSGKNKPSIAPLSGGH